MSAVRISEGMHEEVKRFAALRGQAAGDILAEAWSEYLKNHRDEFAAELETAARLLRDGNADDLAAFASRNVKARAEAAHEASLALART